MMLLFVGASPITAGLTTFCHQKGDASRPHNAPPYLGPYAKTPPDPAIPRFIPLNHGMRRLIVLKMPKTRSLHSIASQL